MIPRIPFDKAIADARLLKASWDEFSPSQQALMRMVYGLPLSSEDLAIWHALHGGGTYDHLGYLTNVHDSGVPYIEGREYRDITLIIGRRAAKSCILSFICTYEALCGGHKARLHKDTQQPEFLLIGQDLKRAMKNKNEYILHYLRNSPMGLQQLQKAEEADAGKKKGKAITAKHIRLPDCGVIIVGAPSLKARGDATAFAGFDEVAFWPTDEKSANPDTEIARAVQPSMREFHPYAKMIKVSTPWTEVGLLWDMYQIGTHGHKLADLDKRAAHSHTVVFKGPSPVLDNPTIIREALMEDLAKDGDAFSRETLANFSKSVSGFLPTPLLRRAADGQPSRRPAAPGVWYTGTIDPAFRQDAFAICIGHLEGDGEFVQDVLEFERGTQQHPLDPDAMLAKVGALAKEYRLTNVLSDQYHQESLAVLAQQHGFFIEPFHMSASSKNTMWRDFVTLLNQNKIRLLDSKPLYEELAMLEKTRTATGNERIAGRRDDLAVVTALCLHRALSYGISSPTVDRPKEPSANDWAEFAARRIEQGMRTPAQKVSWWNRGRRMGVSA